MTIFEKIDLQDHKIEQLQARTKKAIVDLNKHIIELRSGNNVDRKLADIGKEG